MNKNYTRIIIGIRSLFIGIDSEVLICIHFPTPVLTEKKKKNKDSECSAITQTTNK